MDFPLPRPVTAVHSLGFPKSTLRQGTANKIPYSSHSDLLFTPLHLTTPSQHRRSRLPTRTPVTRPDTPGTTPQVEMGLRILLCHFPKVVPTLLLTFRPHHSLRSLGLPPSPPFLTRPTFYHSFIVPVLNHRSTYNPHFLFLPSS